MTTLAAIQGDGWCVIGADSRATDESGFPMQVVTGKIFKNGPAIIAGAGSVRGINILQFGWTAPKRTVASTDLYMTKTFIPSMRKAFLEAGYDMKTDSSAAENDNDFIVAVGGILYNVASDYSWERCKGNLYVAGSGGKLALGALVALRAHKTESTDEACRLLNRAITVAKTYDVFSGGDVDTIIQKA